MGYSFFLFCEGIEEQYFEKQNGSSCENILKIFSHCLFDFLALPTHGTDPIIYISLSGV